MESARYKNLHRTNAETATPWGVERENSAVNRELAILLAPALCVDYVAGRRADFDRRPHGAAVGCLDFGIPSNLGA
jgi:hypothetical protein